MPVVEHGRRQSMVRNTTKPAKARGWVRKEFRVGWGGPRFVAYGRAILEVQKNVATVQEHFGCNISDAFKMAIHLLAQGIRAGRFTPEVPR